MSVKLKKRSCDYYIFYCHGCKYEHTILVEQDGSQWNFNGNMESPSFTPSLKNTLPEGTKGENGYSEKICHLIITNGIINYCTDCTHELAGKSVPI